MEGSVLAIPSCYILGQPSSPIFLFFLFDECGVNVMSYKVVFLFGVCVSGVEY